MNDPWNVKSVRQPGQYQSCMKINGVALLPPVLSKECRREMQYYKMLAKEVEKRISILKPYIEDENNENRGYDPPYFRPSSSKPGYESEHDTLKEDKQIKNNAKSLDRSPKITNDTKMDVEKIKVKSDMHSTNFVLDLSLRINHTDTDMPKEDSSDSSASQTSLLPIELPERDCDSPKVKLVELEKELITKLLKDYTQPKLEKKLQKELILEKELDLVDNVTNVSAANKNQTNETLHVEFDLNTDSLSDAFIDLMDLQVPLSASSKSFTGSLLDIQSESARDNESPPKLVRQRSYTVLTPSPQLMAHLELQSLNEGVDLTTISMSESTTNTKKRRIWDLETAKMKWSSMALELKQKNLASVKNSKMSVNGSINSEKNPIKKYVVEYNASPYRPQSIGNERKIANKNLTKSDPIPKPKQMQNALRKIPSDKTVTKEALSPANKAMIKNSTAPKHNIITKPKTDSVFNQVKPYVPDTENPALRVKELYEKIQQQQLIQMTSLIEKQKKEQNLLQMVFEEQNNILFKQLKMICPKSPIEVRQAWGDKQEATGKSPPVSLSQLNRIPKSLPSSATGSPVSKTLNETNQYINHCNDVLKKSRDITNKMNKPQSIKRAFNNSSINDSNRQRPASPEARNNRSRSPANRNTSRKLNYESASDYEPILTDRTNDTFADLNVTFPSDTEESKSSTYGKSNGINTKDMTVIGKTTPGTVRNSTDEALQRLEESIRNTSALYAKKAIPTQKELDAASKIVAYAKGYLCRRLMRSERVQATVQTIRDALLCALQLHQDREGIRGADVDLHRRLIQQITAACYSLHDTFIASTAAERCALIAADRARRRVSAARHAGTTRSYKQTSDAMSRSHSGVFRSKRPSSAAALMTQSNHETFSGSASQHTPQRPWR